MYADPSGHTAILFIVGLIPSAVIGGLVSGGIAAGIVAISGGDIGAASLTKYLIEQEISKPTTASAFNY